METVIAIILGLHITSGGTALISGFIPMVAKKGGKLHKRTGLIYFWSMMGVVASALVLGAYNFNPFLLIIGVFSFYLTIKGFTGTKIKGKHFSRYARFLAFVALASFLFSLMLLILGFYDFASQRIRLELLPLFFGAAGMATSFSDMKRLFKKAEKLPASERIRSHIGGMVGAYIATVTAFIVANSLFAPAIIGWIAPTVIGTIFISYQTSMWTKKLAGGKSTSSGKSQAA